MLAVSVQGYLFVPASYLVRVAFLIAALALLKPGWETDVAGLLFAATAVGLQLRRRAKASAAH